MRTALVLILAWCLAPVLLAQAQSDRLPILPSSRPEAPQFLFDQITAEDGLAQGRVTGLYQDRQGFIWIGNQSALQRYDGYTFRTYRFSDADSTVIPFGRIERIIEDDAGRLYLGNSGRLFLFEPATGKVRRLYPVPGDSLSSYLLDFVLEGDSVAWIGTTASGIVRLDLRTGARRVYWNRPGDPESLSHNFVPYLYLDPAGILWASTNNGLNRLDPTTGKITRYITGEGIDPNSYVPNTPYLLENILEDPKQPGVLWIGSREGLIRFETRIGEYTRYVPEEYTHYVPDPIADRLNRVHQLAFDPTDVDVLWMTTFFGGLLRFDTVTEQFTRYRHDDNDPNSLLSDQTFSLLTDRNGTLWVGTEGGGISRFNPAAGLFARYQPIPTRTPGSERNTVQSIFEDRDGMLWIGGPGILHRRTGGRSSYTFAPPDIVAGGRGDIYDIEQDAAGDLWITVYGYSLFRRKTSTDIFVALPVDAADSTALCDEFGYALLMDRADMLWAGTEDCLHRIDPSTGRITRFRLQTPADSSIGAWALLQDQEGHIWAGQRGLLASLDPTTGRIERMYRFEPDSANTFSGADINTLYEREREPGVLWVGSYGGLDRLDTRTGKITHLTEKEGLPDNVIYAILEDEEGRLWMSTNSGIVRFDPETHAVKHYGKEAGLRSSEFNWGAAFRSARGELFFGGTDGVYSFFPEQFRDDPYPPQVVLTRLRLFNEAVEAGAPDSPLKGPLSETEELRLRHDQDVVTFEYAGLHYKNPERNAYAYKLEDFDADWVQAGSRREATYTNLDPGRYTFRVKAASADGVWSEEGASIQIMILPPWWRTWWAYVLYGLFFIGGVFAVDRFQRRRILDREREKARERELAQAHEIERAYRELQRTQQQLIQQEKLASLGALTAGIAHEIKNPLNFINNFASLSSDLAAELKLAVEEGDLQEIRSITDDLQLNTGKIEEHGKRADRIVHSMLEHSRGTKGERQEVEVNALVEEYVDLAFHGFRAQHPGFEVRITRDYGEEVGCVELTPQEIGRVLLNLLSNAFYAIHEQKAKLDGQYAPEVKVSTRHVEGQVEIRIEDNGPGIPEAVREKVFEPFFTTKPTGEGTGLGLSLSYDIITQGHGGSLRLESEEGARTAFLIELPSSSVTTQAEKR